MPIKRVDLLRSRVEQYHRGIVRRKAEPETSANPSSLHILQVDHLLHLVITYVDAQYGMFTPVPFEIDVSPVS